MTARGTSARALLAAAVVTGVTATLAVVPPGLPTCRELARGTLRIGGPGPTRTSHIESSVTIEVLEQGPSTDTIRVTASG